MTYEQYVTKRWDVIEIIGPMDHKREIVEKLYEDNWELSSSSPYTNGMMWPEYDPEKPEWKWLG